MKNERKQLGWGKLDALENLEYWTDELPHTGRSNEDEVRSEVAEKVAYLKPKVEKILSSGESIYGWKTVKEVYDTKPDHFWFMSDKLDLKYFKVKWVGDKPYREKASAYVTTKNGNGETIVLLRDVQDRGVGGGIEFNEDPKATIIRECKEELMINVKTVEKISEFYSKREFGNKYPINFAGEYVHMHCTEYDCPSNEYVEWQDRNILRLILSSWINIDDCIEHAPDENYAQALKEVKKHQYRISPKIFSDLVECASETHRKSVEEIRRLLNTTPVREIGFASGDGIKELKAAILEKEAKYEIKSDIIPTAILDFYARLYVSDGLDGTREETIFNILGKGVSKRYCVVLFNTIKEDGGEQNAHNA